MQNSIGLAFAKAVAKHEPGLLVVTGRSAEKYVRYPAGASSS